MKLIELLHFDKNQEEELIQRASWRLVRSALDRFGDNKGEKKLAWVAARLKAEFVIGEEKAEDYARAAYVQFKTERKMSE